MATLSFRSINKIYPNNVQAVFDFNLEVKDKEFIVFVGPSGCGKSTTLRMIAGLEDITYGQLYIDGIQVNNVEPKDRNIAMVFQSYALYPHMTVFNNMAFSLKLRKVKFPAYEENEEANALRAKNVELFKKINQINRVIKKKNEPQEALEEREKVLEEIYDNEAKAKSLLVQKRGISEVELKECETTIKKIQDDLKFSENTIEKCHKKINSLEACLANPNLEEADKIAAEESLKNLKDVVRLTGDGIIQKEAQLQEVISKKKELEITDVPLVEVRKHTPYEIKLEVYKTAKILDLSRYLFRKPAALSGGQRQRVALGRAIVRHPKVFLMDEPLSNLDAKLRVQMRSEIIKIHEDVGATTVYVTHDQTEAMTMASRIVVMKDGYIQQIGTPKEVYSDPANMFVAGFIGSPAMNFFKGKVEKGKFVFNDSDKSFKLNKEQVSILKNYEGKELVLGIRPESIYLSGDVNNPSPTEKFSEVCDFSELLGRELVIYTNISGQVVTFMTSPNNEIKMHDKLEFCFNNKALYFFDKDSQQRIK